MRNFEIIKNLSINRFSMILRTLSKQDFNDDLRIQAIGLLATPENLKEIEELLLPLVNFDALSTQAILNIFKAAESTQESVFSSKNGPLTNVLSKSVAFKQKFKH